jgi:electron transfer flavoprotein alpha subunit
MLAVVFVRDGVVPSGGDEATAECGGRALVCGSGAAAAAATLSGHDIRVVECPSFAPAALAARLAPLIDDDALVLPASPDGRDLAPRLAHTLGRRLFAGAIHVTQTGASLARAGGLEIHDVTTDDPFVATLIPNIRGIDPGPSATPRPVETPPAPTDTTDAEVLEVLGPDVTTMDLAEAPRILSGGAGLDRPERFEQLAAVGAQLGAAMGATRVITDRGWLPHARQIGTTGAVVNPQLYVAFGISGAVQHTAGLGDPDHVISVNTDPHCPMMQIADLAIVADANLVLDELVARLEVERG